MRLAAQPSVDSARLLGIASIPARTAFCLPSAIRVVSASTLALTAVRGFSFEVKGWEIDKDPRDTFSSPPSLPYLSASLCLS
jgi:hypothetical protein